MPPLSDAELQAIVDGAPRWQPPPPEADADDHFEDCLRSLDAAGRDYPAPEMFVDGFLTTGLTVVAASPKAGKTWLAHEMAISVATGRNALGVLPCRQSDALCVFLEDGERRAIARERSLAGDDSGCPGITYSLTGSVWTTERLTRYLDLHPACRVAIIDTAERWRQMQRSESTGRIYSDEYRFWGSLQQLATTRCIALVVIHHDRKPTGSGSGLDTVSGTRAVTGAADHVWLLDRDAASGISTLRVIGRDLDERSIQFSRGADGQLRASAPPILDTVDRINQRVMARRLREGGATFGEVAAALQAPKTTVIRWCADIDPK